VVHNSSDMDIGVGVDTANDSIRVSYDGHCHPSLHRRAGVARTCRTGGPGRRAWCQQDRNTDLPSDR
jgi:hypothetical protein